jgi:hypothetical protein
MAIYYGSIRDCYGTNRERWCRRSVTSIFDDARCCCREWPRKSVHNNIVRIHLIMSFGMFLDSVPIYWNFDTNEQFEVATVVINNRLENICARQVINSTSQTSVIAVNTLIVKPSILLGFDPRNKKSPDWSITYQGNGTSRGLPTEQFTSCFFVQDIKATFAVTYHVLNENVFLAPSPDNQSILLQFSVRVKSENKPVESYTYNVFRFVPNPIRQEQRQALETPAGTYCNGRDPGLPVPKNIPERVSSNTEFFVPDANASIFSAHTLYDTEFQYSRFDAWFPDQDGGPVWDHYVTLHDFSAGLSYQYNPSTLECDVRDIDPNAGDTSPVDGRPDLIQMASPQHLFLFDDIEYQYTGEKPCRDRVLCHVWIGRKELGSGAAQQREWYWAFSINDQPLVQWIPMKLILKNYADSAPTSVFEFSESTRVSFMMTPDCVSQVSITTDEIRRHSSKSIIHWPIVIVH